MAQSHTQTEGLPAITKEWEGRFCIVIRNRLGRMVPCRQLNPMLHTLMLPVAESWGMCSYEPRCPVLLNMKERR